MELCGNESDSMKGVDILYIYRLVVTHYMVTAIKMFVHQKNAPSHMSHKLAQDDGRKDC